MEKVNEGKSASQHSMEMHSEKLIGRTQQIFFSATEEENYLYPFAYDVDFSKKTEFDASLMNETEINAKIRNLMKQGFGDITILNPGSKHSVGIGILNRLNLTVKGSLGYFGCGLIDGPNVRIEGRVGWSCAENMMAGSVVVEKNAGSTFGAAIRGGDLVCKGDVGARTGIDQKGGTIIVGGNTGAFTGFMMQRGRMIILGNAGKNFGDTMYDGLLFVGGKITSLGVDAVELEMTANEKDWIENKLGLYNMGDNIDVSKMKKIGSGKKLWNYDKLEPTEKKLIL